MLIDIREGLQVDAHFGNQTVKTDQPVRGGGNGSASTPFALFLSSIGAYAGIYVMGCCKQRRLSTDNIRIIQRLQSNPMTGLINNIDLEIQVPPEFPEKHDDVLVRPTNQCAEKKHLSEIVYSSSLFHCLFFN